MKTFIEFVKAYGDLDLKTPDRVLPLLKKYNFRLYHFILKHSEPYEMEDGETFDWYVREMKDYLENPNTVEFLVFCEQYWGTTETRCTYCQEEVGTEVYIPVRSYDTHVKVRFYEHQSLTHHRSREVFMCRSCAHEIVSEMMKRADAKKVTFWV